MSDRTYGHPNYRRDPERYYTDGTEKETWPEIEARRLTTRASEAAPTPSSDVSLPFESALVELVDKIDGSLDSGDLLIDARRASAALDAILSKGDLVANAYDHFRDSPGGNEPSVEFRVGWNACLDAIGKARGARAAPVAVGDATTAERAAFEAWYLRDMPHETYLLKRTKRSYRQPGAYGAYEDDSVEDAWVGWQGAWQFLAALASQAVPVTQDAQQASEPEDEEAISKRLVDHTCKRVDYPDTPGMVLYHTEIGRSGAYQPYRHEAVALYRNLGVALGYTIPDAAKGEQS